MIDLKDKTVVITGAASGIGRALALKAASRGARVAVADIDLARAQGVAGEIEAAGGEAKAFSVDVTDLAACEALAVEASAGLGPANLVFSNAGVFSGGGIERTRPADFDWVFAVNVRGLYNVIQAFLAGLRQTAAAGDLAVFVATGSENSLALPTAGPFTAYTATKHAVLGIMDGLRRDLAGSGVATAVICPGAVQTDLWNAKRTRQAQFGGPREAPPEGAAGLKHGRTSEETAQTVFEGLDAGDFIIVTDPRVRSFTEPRLAEIAAALDACDRRVARL